MFLIYKKSVLLLSICFLFSCFPEQIEKNLQGNDSELVIIENITILNSRSVTIQDLSYGENSQQTFDIYLPDERSSNTTKVIVLIHGGSWISGDKSAMEDLIPILQNANPHHAIVNMNYVLSNDNTHAFPNQFYNISTLLDELCTRSTEFQINPEFALIGRSAGGHLALMYDSVYDELDRVKMVCTLSGPTDFTNSFYTDKPNFESLFDKLVDVDAYPPNQNLVRKLSPALRVNWDTSPTIIFHGKEDNIVPVANAKKLKRKLKKKDIPKRLFRFDGEGHGNWSEETMEFVDLKLNRFIANHFSI
ncbi:MAG: acetyl esterase/lipase [Saprospiraceae bacterium]|jgi:acetyl esterase/lipase|uniref:prolyl oligopeptidase family serine peptidase n=1 Tax=Candidatus Marifrigoribacter sp. Uisw_064 TaxID=3230970 RepID=UPI003AE6CC93